VRADLAPERVRILLARRRRDPVQLTVSDRPGDRSASSGRITVGLAPCFVSTSTTLTSLSPHATAGFASGQRSHHCKTVRSSRVASLKPCAVSGAFARARQGKTL
jgi:hypothetical protein